MAARVTKLFLQNCASIKVDASESTMMMSKSFAPHATLSKNTRRKLRKRGRKVSGKPKVKLLEEARLRLEKADQTIKNLRKLKNKTSVKSQRLLAKVLALRNVAFR